MSQFDFGTINPNSKSGAQLALDLNNFRNALNSGHKGSVRPSYAQAGMLWVRETSSAQWDLMWFDGDTDFAIRSINPTKNTLLEIPSSQIDGLGTAATATVSTSQTDTVAGRLLKTNDYGIGNAITLAGGTDLNTVLQPATYAYLSGSPLLNAPVPSAGILLVEGRAAYPHQTWKPVYGVVIYTRSAKVASPTSSAADWNAWGRQYSTENVGAFMQTLMPAATKAAAKTTLGVIDGVGVNQTIQDVTASRALATTYTNSTGKPILVWVSGTQTSSASPGAFNATVAESLLRGTSTYGSGQGFSIAFIVPPGATYSVAFVGTSYDTLNWKEYR